MSVIDILYTILIGPLQLIFEIIYNMANNLIGDPGLAIIVLSLIMNFLVLPLYRRADAMQEAARDVENKLHDGVAHIKKSFSGDERMMILQTYYRQNNYKPTSALNGSVSLLLEIPFFIAAYNFLSHLNILQGASLGPIVDLGAPDELLTIAGVTINVLPFIMTLINIISSAIFLKGFPLKTKIQLYGMALFFLVFLYTSPSGLVFYWTINNLFSLVKTLFYKLKKPRKVFNILCSLAGILSFISVFWMYDTPLIGSEWFGIYLGIMLQLPLIMSLLEGKVKYKSNKVPLQNNTKFFILGCIFMTMLVGILIPSNLIAASPQEFIDVNSFYSPMWYIGHTLCIAIGFFLVWMRVFYWIANLKGKEIFDKIIWVSCGIMLVNYMFLGTDLGNISAALQYDTGMYFEMFEVVKNIFILIVISILMLFIMKKWKKQVGGIVLVAILAMAGMSGLNIYQISDSVAQAEEIVKEIENTQPHFRLSKNGKNVIVFMLDRAIGFAVPYMFNEKPELKEQFDGFTYYSNVIAYGAHTNFAAPSLFGGYEYTPVEMNQRDDELLVDKHNEALRVMPVLFDENGYEVTVCDQPYGNYSWITDLSIYDEYPNINAYITEGRFNDKNLKQAEIDITSRNFFCFSLMKTMPLVFQEGLYEQGNYNQVEGGYEEITYSEQNVLSNTRSEGIKNSFMKSYNVLCNLSNMTHITEDDKNTFLVMVNNATHEQMLLQEPEYEPAMKVDNTKYYMGDNLNRFTVDGRTMYMDDNLCIRHYDVNMAAMIKLGEWFEYMKQNDVYDNTRIIIVSDHGSYFISRNDGIADTVEDKEGIVHGGRYFPMLLVKDFNSEGFMTSDTFMTNADVPVLATDGLIENPRNPFTNNFISSEKKNGIQYLINSANYDVNENNGYVFEPSTWMTVKENIWEDDNWGRIDEEVILPKEINGVSE